MRDRRLRAVVPALVAAMTLSALASCKDASEPASNPAGCPAVSHTGATSRGCVVVRGYVVDTLGRPRTQPVTVEVKNLLGGVAVIRSPIGTADSVGYYQLTAHRWAVAADASTPDTVSTSIGALSPSTECNGPPSCVLGGGVVLPLRFRPSGATPDTVVVPTITVRRGGSGGSSPP